MRGFAVVCVVIGHVCRGCMPLDTFKDLQIYFLLLNNTIYLFHMPLMFMISGYAFKLAYVSDRGIDRKRIIIQLVNFVWNYCLWSILMVCTNMMFSGSVNTNRSLEDIAQIPIVAVSPYWYLYALFFMYIILILITQLKLNIGFVIAISAITSMIWPFISEKWQTELTITEVFPYFIFFVIGIYMDKCVWGFGRFLITGLTGFVFEGLGVYFAFVKNEQLEWQTYPIIGTLGAFSICFILIYIFNKMKNVNVLALAGRYSLQIYVMHVFITAANRSILIKLGIRGIVYIPISTIIAVLIPILASAVLRKAGIYEFIFKPAKYIKHIKNHGKKY